MSHGDSRLIGAWERVGVQPCAAQYPLTWRIDANGLYEGQAAQPGEFTWWDSGTWRVHAPGQLSLSVANDEVIAYRYTLEDKLLHITDGKGCAFDYRRVG